MGNRKKSVNYANPIWKVHALEITLGIKENAIASQIKVLDEYRWTIKQLEEEVEKLKLLLKDAQSKKEAL